LAAAWAALAWAELRETVSAGPVARDALATGVEATAAVAVGVLTVGAAATAVGVELDEGVPVGSLDRVVGRAASTFLALPFATWEPLGSWARSWERRPSLVPDPSAPDLALGFVLPLASVVAGVVAGVVADPVRLSRAGPVAP
jgi:hypothetical protein